mgnify:CR=1 FL=1
MNVEFANLTALYFVWLAPALGLWWFVVQRRREAALAAFVAPPLQAKLRPPAARARFAWQAALTLAGLLLALLAAARPQWGLREETVLQRGRDLVIALDVSRSMLAQDLRPSRLERAKADLLDLIKELRGDRAALLVFRRQAVLLCPLTTDYAFLRQALDAADIDSAPAGETDLGDAILKGLDAFEEGAGAHKAMILISDGEDLSGRALTAAEEARRQNVPIFAVGLGSRAGATIPAREGAGAQQYQGQDVVTRLNNETLYNIAKTTGGAYVPVETASMTSMTLGTLYRDHLRQIVARELEETLQRRRVERFQLFLLPAVLCWLGSLFLSRGRLQVRAPAPSAAAAAPPAATAAPAALRDLTPPPPALKTLALAGFVALAAPGWAQTNAPPPETNAPAAAQGAPSVAPGLAGARQAQGFYRLGQYEKAAQAYLEAARSAPREAARDFRYNAALSWYRAGRFQEAADLLREIAPQSTGARQSDALEALGAALFHAAGSDQPKDAAAAAARAQRLREAGEAFKAAWRNRAADEAARKNLAAALAAWPEAEQEAKIARLAEKYQTATAGQIADEMLQAQRRIDLELAAAATNTRPERIRQLETLADRQDAAADLWIPLKGKLLAALTQAPNATNAAQQAALLEQMVEATRDNMYGTAEHLRNLDEAAAQQGVAAAQGAVYRLWKSMADYPQLLREDLYRQTNALAATRAATDARQRQDAAAQQLEALDLTRRFAERFAAAVPEGGTQSATNAPPQTPSTNAPPPAAGI